MNRREIVVLFSIFSWSWWSIRYISKTTKYRNWWRTINTDS